MNADIAPATPLPWKQGSDPAVDHKIYGPYCIVDCAPGGEKNRNAANAAYIVHCANAYPTMQAAIDELVEFLREALPKRICLTNSNIPDSSVVPLDVTMGDLRQMAALIAKHKGAGQ